MGEEGDPPLNRKETGGSTSGGMTANNQQLQGQDMVTFMSQQMEEQRKMFREEQARAEERWTKMMGQQQAQHAKELKEMKEMAGTSTRQQVVVSTERHNTPVLNVDDLFDVYKTAVQCWEKAVKDNVPAKKRAAMLLNNLPDGNDRLGGIKAIMERNMPLLLEMLPCAL